MAYKFTDALPIHAVDLIPLVTELGPPAGISPYLLMGIAYAESNYGRALKDGSGDFIPRQSNPTRDGAMKKNPLPAVVLRRLDNGIPARGIKTPVQAWCPTVVGWAVGPFQLDWESHRPFIERGAWKDLRATVGYVVNLLVANRKHLARECGVVGDALDEAMIASYNAGAGRVAKFVKAKKPVDDATFHTGYIKKIQAEADRVAGVAGAWRSLPQEATNA